MTTPIQQDLIVGNEKYAATFDQGHLALPPSKKYLVLTCMDARIDPTSAFAIPLGAAHVIRNAGASARDALRSIIISQQLLGTEEILLVKHTGCGMLTFQNEDAYQIVGKGLGPSQEQKLREGNFDFLPFPQLEDAIRSDVEWLRGNELVREIEGADGKQRKVSGWVYEVETGKVRKVA